MQQDSIQLTRRYSWRTLLQAVGIGFVAQTLTLIVLKRIASHDIAVAASCGVFWAAVSFWSPVTRRRRYWPGLAVAVVVSVLLWVLAAGLLSLFDL